MDPAPLLLIGALLALSIVLNLHVAASLGLMAFVLMYVFSDRPLWAAIAQVAWNTNTNSILVAIPLFILMGELLTRSGLMDSVYRTVADWLNWLPGGLLHANIVASAIFAACCGSSLATVATIGTVSLPTLEKKKYDRRLVAGSLAAGGTLGILIPPSIVMIVYAVLVETSIGKLYMAGIVPGILLTLMFMVTILVATRWWTCRREEPVSWRVRFKGLRSIVPVTLIVFLVLGTIYMGIATASEAAAFGCVGAFFIALLAGKVSRRMLREVFLSTAITTSFVMLIVTAAFVMQFALARLGVTGAVAKAVTNMQLSAMDLVLVICAVYIVIGMFLDAYSIVVTTLPLLVPMLKAANVDLIWFGIITVVLVEIGLITPPYGMNLFTIQGMRKRMDVRTGAGVAGGEQPMWEVYVGSLPFCVAALVTIGLIIAFPQIALWLPGMAAAK
jgi:tripartite ATP-independent transporter DctM subunit